MKPDLQTRFNRCVPAPTSARVLIRSILALAATPVFAATPPMDQVFPENEIASVECEYAKDEKATIDEEKPVPKGVYHYRVYIPKGYYASGKRRYPCLFIASPGGNAGMDNVAAYAKEHRWFVVMLVESSNAQDFNICLANFLAAHDDVVKRFRISSCRKVTTGMSGGARVASFVSGHRPGICGMVLQAAGYAYHSSGPRKGYYITDALQDDRNMLVYVLIGDADDNRSEVRRLLAESPSYTGIAVGKFSGGHDWSPQEEMTRALDWITSEYPARSNNRVFAREVFLEKADPVDGETPLAAYQRMVDCLGLTRKNGLATDAEVRPLAAEMAAKIAQMEKDEALAADIAAVRDLAAADEAVRRYRDTPGGKNPSALMAKGKLRSFIGQYQKVAAAYPGTQAAVEAAARAAALEAEMAALPSK